MARFLFCSLGSPGMLYPAIGMARVLRARGHHVAFVTHAKADDDLARHELERIPRGPTDGPSFQTEIWAHPLSVLLQVKHVEYALAQFAADVLVGQQLTLGPLLVGERRGLPVASLGFCTYLWPWPGASSIHTDEEVARKAWRLQDMLRIYNEARVQAGLPKLTPADDPAPFLGDLFMVRSVRELETEVDDYPDRVHLVGDCLFDDDRPDPPLEAWLDEAEAAAAPIVYVQHGRFFDAPHFWNALVSGLADLPVRVAASTGRLDCAPGDLPASFFVRPHVSQARVLRRAAVMVASANSTAVLGALTAGVPSLLVPAGGEQPDVAARCAAAGVARTLEPAAATAEMIRDQVEALLLDRAAFLPATRRIADAFARVTGMTRAVELLEQLARERAPISRRLQAESVGHASV